MPGTTTDPRKLDEKERQQKVAEKQEMLDWEWLLTQPPGQRIVRKIFEYCGIFKSSFTGNSTTFFNEGLRSVGLWMIGKIIWAKPEHLVKVLVQTQDQQENEEDHDD